MATLLVQEFQTPLAISQLLNLLQLDVDLVHVTYLVICLQLSKSTLYPRSHFLCTLSFFLKFGVSAVYQDCFVFVFPNPAR